MGLAACGWRLIRWTDVFAGIALFLWLAPPALAAGDFRMTVEIPAEGKARGQPRLAALMRQAVPILWDRLIPQAQRAAAGGLTGTPRMVSRIISGTDAISVEFDRQAVFEYLSQAHMRYIKSPPAIHLVIQMRNSVGVRMPQTEDLLTQYAHEVALRWGLRLGDGAPELLVHWAWMDAHRIRLSLAGVLASPEAQERVVGEDDLLQFMQAWLKGILLEARDRLSLEMMQEKPPAQDGETSVWLLIERPLSLGEQAVLEDAMRSDPRVLQLIPHTYSHRHIRYRMIVTGQETGWIREWFRQRAFQVRATADGLVLR